VSGGRSCSSVAAAARGPIDLAESATVKFVDE
jgi:hypothetical protein